MPFNYYYYYHHHSQRYITLNPFVHFVEESKNMGRIFETQISTLQISLDEAENALNSRISAPVPRDLDSLEHMVIQHKDFEQRLLVPFSP